MLECRFYLTEKERLGRSGYAVGLSAISLLASSRSKIPVPKSRPRSQIPLPLPNPVPAPKSRSQRMPLQSLTQSLSQ